VAHLVLLHDPCQAGGAASLRVFKLKKAIVSFADANQLEY
jgi:hypothetical protein